MDSQEISWKEFNTCIFCKEWIEKNNHFYTTHSISISKYFTKFRPKIDLITGKPIEFKSIEQYFLADFNDKAHLKSYLEKLSLPEKQAYLTKLFKKRIEMKNIQRAPSQIELKTIGWPSIKYFNLIFQKVGGYYGFCHKLGLSSDKEEFKIETLNTLKQYTNETILIDTREQKNFKLLTQQREVATLNYGDYKLKESGYGSCAIERKSLVDFINSFGAQHERLEAEIIRAKQDNHDLIVLVEEDLQSALSFNTHPKYRRFIKATPDYVFHNVRELAQKYDNLQFLFVKNRVEASIVMITLLLNWTELKKYDLQSLYDMAIL